MLSSGHLTLLYYTITLLHVHYQSGSPPNFKSQMSTQGFLKALFFGGGGSKFAHQPPPPPQKKISERIRLSWVRLFTPPPPDFQEIPPPKPLEPAGNPNTCKNSCAAELFVSISHSFQDRIAGAIFLPDLDDKNYSIFYGFHWHFMSPETSYVRF